MNNRKYLAVGSVVIGLLIFINIYMSDSANLHIISNSQTPLINNQTNLNNYAKRVYPNTHSRLGKSIQQKSTGVELREDNIMTPEEMYPALAALLSQDNPEEFDEHIRRSELERVSLIIDSKILGIKNEIEFFSGHSLPKSDHYKEEMKDRLTALEELRARIITK